MFFAELIVSQIFFNCFDREGMSISEAHISPISPSTSVAGERPGPLPVDEVPAGAGLTPFISSSRTTASPMAGEISRASLKSSSENTASALVAMISITPISFPL